MWGNFKGASIMKENWEKVGEISGPDSKYRIVLSLALKKLDGEIDGFTVYKNPTGEIKLVPVVRVPASEAWLYNNSRALEDVRVGMEEALAGKAGPLSRFRRKHKK